MPDSQYPSASGAAASPFNRGPMASVDGDYAAPASATPSSFGSNVDLASAFEGTLSDMRAVAQQTIKTLSDIGVMAQRVSSMLGGTGGRDGITAPPVPNQLPPSPFGSNTSSANITAAISQAIGLSYGSAANATPQFNPSYATLPPEITNPAFASIPSGFGGHGGGLGTAQPVPNQVPSPKGDDSSAPAWEPSTGQQVGGEKMLERLKQITSNVLGVEAVENRGGERAHNAQALVQRPSVRSITQELAGRIQAKLPASYTSKYQNKPWEHDD